MGLADRSAGRRGSTVLNPRSYFKDELWQHAPVLTGSTCFEPLSDAKNILVTGGAGFMYVQAHCIHMVVNQYGKITSADAAIEPAGSSAI